MASKGFEGQCPVPEIAGITAISGQDTTMLLYRRFSFEKVATPSYILEAQA